MERGISEQTPIFSDRHPQVLQRVPEQIREGVNPSSASDE